MISFHLKKIMTTQRVHPCPISKYFSGLTTERHEYVNSGYCVGLDLESFSIAMKPWQCQVEINLLMPEYMIAIGKKLKYLQVQASF